MKIYLFFITLFIVSNVSAVGMRYLDSKYEVLKTGEGRMVKKGDSVWLHASATLKKTGEEIWSSRWKEESEWNVTTGKRRLISRGLESALIGLKKGEVRRVDVPWIEGYGHYGIKTLIPAQADLIFEVELLYFDPENKDYAKIVVPEWMWERSIWKDWGKEESEDKQQLYRD